MPIKIVGFMIAMTGSFLFGFYYTGKMKRRINELSDVLKALNLIKTEISFKLTQKQEIFKKINLSIESGVAHIFRDIPSFGECALIDCDIRIITEFIESFGRLDYHSQINRLEWCEKCIEDNLYRAKEEYQKYARLAKGFSPLVIGALCLLLF